MTADKDVLLSPVGEVQVVEQGLAPRLDTLKGKVGGLLDNNKVNSDVFLARVRELLTERYGLAGIVGHKKPDTSRASPPEMIDDLAKRCAFVVHAHAD